MAKKPDASAKLCSQIKLTEVSDLCDTHNEMRKIQERSKHSDSTYLIHRPPDIGTILMDLRLLNRLDKTGARFIRDDERERGPER